MPLTVKEKHLVAVGVSIAAGCKPCTNHHVKKAKEAEISAGEIRQAIEIAANIRQNAAEIMRHHGLRQLDVLGEVIEPAILDKTGKMDRILELLTVGAAFAVNCTSTLREHLKVGAEADITQDEMNEVAQLTQFIKGKAASHVEKLVRLEENPASEKSGYSSVERVSACC